MSLIVEDGSIVTNANALITVVYFKEYADLQGWDYSTYDDTTDIEPAIVRGSQHISDGFSYGGIKQSRDQSFSWPRHSAYDGDGYVILSTVIPTQVMKASCEAAWRELQNANSLDPDVTLSDRVTSETVGPISTSYASLPNNPNATRPDVKKIRNLLRGLTVSRSSSLLVRS